MIRQKLQQDQITVLKQKNQAKLDVLRYILSQVKDKEIEKNPPAGGELNDEETLTVLRKVAKELDESIEFSKKANRSDLAEKSTIELQIVSSYLPPEMLDEDLKKEINRLIKKNKDLYNDNPKAIIGVCIKELKSKASPQRIMKILQEKNK